MIFYLFKKAFAESELDEVSVIRNYRITAADGKIYYAKHYNIAAIIAVSYKVNSERDNDRHLTLEEKRKARDKEE